MMDRGRPTRASKRGVTLVELMAVVTIIGLFTALAAPSMRSILADRYASDASQRIAAMFTLAHARATSTGAAHVVRVIGSGTATRFVLVAAITPTSPPSPSCRGLDLGAMTTVSCFDLAPTSDGCASLSAGGVRITPLDDATSSTDYCVSAGGRPQWGSNGTFTTPSGAAHATFQVDRVDTSGNSVGIVRQVVVTPRGTPRIMAN